MNQVFCTFNGLRMWAPFFAYFLCRKFGAKKLVAYFAFPAAVAVAEFFIDNPFVSVMTSLSVSQFRNIGLMQLASVTGVVGVSFVVALCASVVNYIWEERLNRRTVITVVAYGIAVVMITGIGMSCIQKITTGDQTVRVATSVENTNLFAENMDILEKYDGTSMEKIISASLDIIENRAKDATYNGSSVLVFPEDAFMCTEDKTEYFIGEVKRIAKENNVNILFPLLRFPDVEVQDDGDVLNYVVQLETRVAESGLKRTNTLNFIDQNGELLNTYVKITLYRLSKNHLPKRATAKPRLLKLTALNTPI